MDKKQIGEWKILRKSDKSLEIELPEGMKITGEDFTIEDLLDAIQKYKVFKSGEGTSTQDGEVTVKCCHGNTAIA